MPSKLGRISWGETGNKKYETGTKNGVLYLMNNNGEYDEGYAWDGLTAVTESPSGAEITSLYADDGKYIDLVSAEEFGGTIEAYQSPEQFDACDGSATLVKGVNIGQQDRKRFGFCYRTIIGNDVKSNAYGYKLHIVYGCLASVSSRNYQTTNESPEAMTLSWEFKSTPVAVKGFKPTALVTIDSTKVDPAKLAEFEDILYGKDEDTSAGTAAVAPRLPLPDEIAAHFNVAG